MLVESDPLHEGGSFEREREIRSTSVFLSGMFPEYVGDAAEARLRLDSLLDYVKAAKESCRIRPVRARVAPLRPPGSRRSSSSASTDSTG